MTARVSTGPCGRIWRSEGSFSWEWTKRSRSIPTWSESILAHSSLRWTTSSQRLTPPFGAGDRSSTCLGESQFPSLSVITSKSISRGGGRTSYRGLLEINPGAVGSRANVRCDALILDPQSRSDTYPTMKINEKQSSVAHEATVTKVGEEQLFYLQSRGLSAEEAVGMVVNGFIEPIIKVLPLEYAVELNRLIELEMEGSVG